MKKIYLISFLMFAISSCSNTNCDCVDELNSMNYTTSKYNNCLDLAIYDGGADDPLGYHNEKCNN
jgi:hypothetical protein